MIRNRARSLKRRIVLETLETRETPAAMGLAASWANSLRAAVIADGTSAAIGIANPPSSNVTIRPDGSYNPPGTLSPDGMSTTHSLRINPPSSNVTIRPDGSYNPPGTISPDGRLTTRFLRFGAATGGGVVTTPSVTTPSVTTPSVTIPSVTARFSSSFLRSVSPGSIAAPGVTVPSVTVPSVNIPSITVESPATGITS